MTKIAIVQARMGSSRLPGKVLMDVAGEPMLTRVVTRLRRARRLDRVVVATTQQPEDDAIVRLCGRLGAPVHRGSVDDVLDRYYQAAKREAASVVVRVTSDCPLIDPSIVDGVVEALRAPSGADYASNTLDPRTYPRGLDVEAFTIQALERAWREDENPLQREHVTPFIYRNPDRFRLRLVTHGTDESRHRWTVDVPEDLMLVRAIYSYFGHDRFTWLDVLRAFRDHPEWTQLNMHVRQKEVP